MREENADGCKLDKTEEGAFLPIMVAQMEHHLNEVCDILAEVRNLKVRTTDLKGENGFEPSVAYLQQFVALDAMDVLNFRGALLKRPLGL